MKMTYAFRYRKIIKVTEIVLFPKVLEDTMLKLFLQK